MIDKKLEILEDSTRSLISMRISNQKNKSEIMKHVQNIADCSDSGIPKAMIEKICTCLIFHDGYDVSVKRKLLYAMIPEDSDFPYQILPLAISAATVLPSNFVFQKTVLHWVAMLLEYSIIDSSNRYLHICYTSLFGLLGAEKNGYLAAKILYKITQRCDVKQYRVQELMRLRRKPIIEVYLRPLLRLYKTFRPDLVVNSFSQEKKFPDCPKHMIPALTKAKERIEQPGVESMNDFLWSETTHQNKKRKTMNSAIPVPTTYFYAERLEEKVEKSISICQYKRLKDMIADVRHWNEWKWPNSPASLLSRPILLPFFKPHDKEMYVAISCWLEFALKTEIVEEMGNRSQERKRNLLKACISLVKHCNKLVPVVYHFIADFMTVWDQVSFMDEVLELISCLPFFSDLILFEEVLEVIQELYCKHDIIFWCRLTNALSSLAVEWALQEYTLRQNASQGHWPLSDETLSPTEGIFFLNLKMAVIFGSAVVKFDSHPLILHTCLNFYEKVNIACEVLNLPLFIVPPPDLALHIVTKASLSATHSLGKFLTKMSHRVVNLEKFGDPQNKELARYCLSNIVGPVNTSIKFFLDGTTCKMAFKQKWMNSISAYFDESYNKYITTVEGIHGFASITQNLAYSPLFISLSEDYNDDQDEIMEAMLVLLKELGLDGLEQCRITYPAHWVQPITA